MLNERYSFSGSTQTIVDLDKWQQSVDLMSELYGSVNGSIVQLQNNEFKVVVTSCNKDNHLDQNDSWAWDMKSFCRKIVETKKALYIHSALEDNYWKDAPPVVEGPVRSYCGLPIYWPDGSLFGTICVIDNKTSEYSSTLIKLLEQFCQLITADLKMYCDFEELKSLALSDELTGLNNRRGLTVLGEQRIKDATRYKQTLGIVYFDIDNLKKVNDQLGHQVGDHCISALAKVLELNCRENDIKARVGGDEFIIITLLNDVKEGLYKQSLIELSERILNNYCSTIQKYDPTGITSVSCGGVTFDHHELHSLDEMIKKADELMYLDKQSKA